MQRRTPHHAATYAQAGLYDDHDPRSEMTFMVIENPRDARNASYRRRVRSHTTTMQHKRARRHEVSGEQEASFVQQAAEGYENVTDVRRPKHARLVKPSAGTRRDMAEEVKAAPSGSILHARKREDEHLYKTQQTASSSTQPHVFSGGNAASVVPTGVLESAFSRGELAARTFLFHDQENVVGWSLRIFGLDLASTLECYKYIVQVQSRDFESNVPDMPTLQPGTIWKRFWDFIFLDPALITVAVLLSITFLNQLWGSPPTESRWFSILQIRGFLIRTISGAFADGRRSTSDQLLVAVALASAFEIKYNSAEGYHAHMRGLIHMIRMRGGLSEIAKTDPFCERLLLWLVANTSAMPRGENVYYQEISKTSSVFCPPKPDNAMFQMRHEPARQWRASLQATPVGTI